MFVFLLISLRPCAFESYVSVASEDISTPTDFNIRDFWSKTYAIFRIGNSAFFLEKNTRKSREIILECVGDTNNRDFSSK